MTTITGSTLTATRSADSLAAVTPKIWAQANQALAAKILSEFIYEEMIEPETLREDEQHARFALRLGEAIRYEFRAKRRAFFGFYRVEGDTIQRTDSSGSGAAGTIEVETLLNDLHLELKFQPEILAPAFRELSNTLFADCQMLGAKNRLRAEEWLSASDARVEGELSAHPWIVANKSRMGFSVADYERYAPESARTLRLRWLALSRGRGEFHAMQGRQYADCMEQVLGSEELALLESRIREQGRSPEDYFLIPAHPWQFENRIAYLFVRDLARGDILDLGEGTHQFLPQQSIRTLTNVTRPDLAIIKLPISILNTSVYRGLPVDRAANAPKLTQWLHQMVSGDKFLDGETRAVLLGEFATTQCRHSLYSNLPGVPYQYNEMFGVIFRESPANYLEAGERALPLAALFQRDPYGDSILAALIKDSGLTPAEWMDALLKAVMEPLLHFLYKYGFVFSPHGQNALIALKGSRPTRLLVKDFVDDANLSIDSLPEHESLPEALYDLLDALEPLALIQWIQSGLFVCVFRYLTEILEDDGLMTEREFWQRTSAVIRAYQNRFPEMSERYRIFNLYAPAFPKLCLNATRLMDIGYADSAERPSASVASLLDNPLFMIEESNS